MTGRYRAGPRARPAASWPQIRPLRSAGGQGSDPARRCARRWSLLPEGEIRMSRHALVAALVVSALAAGPARADTTIDTTPFWDGAQHVYPFGSAGTGSTPTYGQS